jgi:hypothetical protein
MKDQKKRGWALDTRAVRGSHALVPGLTVVKIARELRMSNQSNSRRKAVSKRVQIDNNRIKDRTIPTRRQKLFHQIEEEDLIRYALINGASAVLEREAQDVDETRIR